MLVAIPIAPDQAGALLDPSLFFALAVMSVGVLGSLMAGWSSANKFSLLGGLRVAAQLMAYELPFVLAAVSPAMAAGTLSLSGIIDAWEPWWLLWQLPALIVFFVAGLAELQRPPFDMPVADAEIIFGPYTEYTGHPVRAVPAGRVRRDRRARRRSRRCCSSAAGTGRSPDELGWLWTLLKIGAVSFLVIWLRVAYPRLREDQLQRLAWTGLVPLGAAAARDHDGGSGVRDGEPLMFARGLLTGLKVTLRNLDAPLGHRALPRRVAGAAAAIAWA